MLISKYTTIKWSYKFKKKYVALGYEFTKFGDSFDIDIKHLTDGSKAKVDVKCDYCKKVFKKEYRMYISGRLEIEKDCCSKCQQEKSSEICMLKHGVKNWFQLESSQKKHKDSMVEKYGVDHNFKVKDIVDRKNLTILNKYGFKNPMQNPSVKQKARTTLLNNYGHLKQGHPDIVKKTISTNIEKYGVEYPMQLLEIFEKAQNTLYNNGNAPCSSQQVKINSFVNGNINYPVIGYYLDIAIIDEMIYVEYDGGGHDLSVKLGNLTMEEFETKQRNRTNRLYGLGWKCIRIICPKDNLPKDDVLKTIVESCIYNFKNNNNNQKEIQIIIR